MIETFKVSQISKYNISFLLFYCKNNNEYYLISIIFHNPSSFHSIVKI